jgi:ubiquinone/menaquinone biosynthesis C-methylase UbiE
MSTRVRSALRDLRLFQPEGVRGAHVPSSPCGDECRRERACGEEQYPSMDSIAIKTPDIMAMQLNTTIVRGVMANPFNTENIAAGYANCRPPVHARVIQRVFRQMERTEPFLVALDIGCGAGLSTKALTGFAKTCVGLEPNESMLAWSPTVAPFATFIAGIAEAIPLRDHCVDLMTAAGSLNYVDLDLFFHDAARILTREGVLVVYDFSPGRRFQNTGGLDEWYAEFYSRYPPPANESRDLSPSVLASVAPEFRLRAQENFEIAIPLTAGFYVEYMMTETNISAAVRRGVSRSEIKSWCIRSLEPLWQCSEQDVVFPGYFACMGVA